jgi:photosystem II stability/assembly factor-like uncharacterized protein
MSKEEEHRIFHLPPVKGMDAAERMAGYRQRLRLKEASPFGGLQWRNIGPEVQSGRVVDIQAPLDHPDHVLVAFATGGLWRTKDDGITWESLFDNLSAFGIGSVAVTRDGNTIWVGTGEPNSQRTSYSGTGVYKSVDAGKTWQHMGLKPTHHIGKVLIHPRNPNIVYVAALGRLYSQNPERGVFKTTDGGRTWQHVLKIDEYTGAISMTMDPRNPDVIHAAAWDRDRRAWNFRESGPGSAVYRTTDGARTWQKVTALPTGTAAGRIGLTQSVSHPNVMYALIDNQSVDPDWPYLDERVPSGRLTPRRFLLLDEEMFLALDRRVLAEFWRSVAPSDAKLDDVIERVKKKELDMAGVRRIIERRSVNTFEPDIVHSEVYRSDDGGRTWRRTDRGQLGSIGGYYWGKVYVNPHDPDDVYVLGVPLLRSQDGGRSWHRTAVRSHVDYHALWFDPRNPQKVWIGNDGGTYLSYDGGTNFRHLNNLAVGQATTIGVDTKHPYNVYLGFQDNGTMRGPSNYVFGRSDPNDWKSLFGGDGSAIANDPRDGGDVVYVASQFGNHFGINQRTGERWSARANPPAGDPPARYNWISPILISPHHSDIIYLGAQRLYRSFNMGRNYHPISPDITKNLPNGDVPYSTLKDISESPLRFGLIFVGADDGTVKMTPNGGHEWIDISTPEPRKWVSRVVASKWDENVVYVAQNGYREDDFRPYLWRSDDQGRTWRSIVGNLPPEPINVIREDPLKRDLLYVGTDMGVYVTFDGGASWETLHGGIPHTPVHDIAVQYLDREVEVSGRRVRRVDDDLVIATHARSAWILPLARVRGLTKEIREADLTLFEVDNVRRGNWGFDSRPRWDGRPPAAPTVEGTFYSRHRGAGTVRIKDAKGNVVKERTLDVGFGYNSFEIDLETQPARPGTANVRDRQVRTVEDVLRDPHEPERPQYLPVGEYTIEVEVAGRTANRPFRITATP